MTFELEKTMTTHRNKTIRIVICGIGGVGGYYGGLLARLAEVDKSIEVDFVAKAGEHLTKIKCDGLKVQTPSEEFVVHPHCITSNPAELATADYIVLATKSYDLTESIHSLSPLFHPDTIVLPLLNGLDVHEDLAALLPEQLIRWGGCAFITVRKVAPGLIRSASTIERLVMGDLRRGIGAERTAEETRLEQIMAAAGINVLCPDDVMDEVHKKYLMLSNIAAATAYFDSYVDVILSEHRDFLVGLTEDLIALYIAEGYTIEEDAVEAAIRRIDRMPKQSTTSMHSDIISDRSSELESLVGYVISRSEYYGLKAPHYREAYAGILRRISRG